MVDFDKQPRLDVFKSELVKDAYFSPVHEFPLIKRTDFKPEKAIPFEKASTSKALNQWVHFYTHDRNFECVWNNPKQYINLFKRFDGRSVRGCCRLCLFLKSIRASCCAALPIRRGVRQYLREGSKWRI